MELIRRFEQLNKSDVALAGGKGASLGEMKQVGLPVPPGFVILATAFENFLAVTDLNVEIDAILDTVKNEEMHTVEYAAEKIQALILNAEMPAGIQSEIENYFQQLGAEYVAVRSSATAEDSSAAAWAGQLDSFLNTTEQTLLENVKKCWASLFTPRAIFYRFEKNLHKQKISVAVVVQKMVNSEKSGIAFSVHPVTENPNQLIIEAGYGLGEAIVSGAVTPDSYVVTKQPRGIIDINVSNQGRALYRIDGGGNEWKDLGDEGLNQVLNTDQINELSDLIIKIEDHYGFPCDIEWAFENGRFFITQSRPITTLTAGSAPKHLFSKFFTRDFSLPALEVWYRGETTVPKEWTTDSQPFLPYIVFERSDSTVACYYDMRGVEWVRKLLVDMAKKDSEFIPMLCRVIPEKLKYVKPIYEEQRVLSKEELVKFMKELEGYYPWFEAMWWLMELKDEELGGLDVSTLREIRKETNDLSTGTDIVIRKSLKAIYPDLAEYVGVLTVDEIVNNNLPSNQELKARDKGFYFTNNHLYTGASREEIENEFNLTLEKTFTEDFKDVLKGEIAYKGVVQGKVRRVMGHKQIGEIEEGEILVSAMTMPDFLPAMKKAAAIVTDEGGIACHAAIVARELNKPCVVGTKIATQVLNDGDMVEVDADSGTVRLISTYKLSGLEYNPENYVRMFAGEAFAYLFVDIFLGHYASLDVLVVQGEHSWMTFLPKNVEARTLKEGYKLYTNKNLYQSYFEEFQDYLTKSSVYFDSILGKERLAPNDVREFFSQATKHFSYYSKTEFFYTDKLEPEKMVISVAEFDQLKLTGRSALNKLLFEGNGFVQGLIKKIAEQCDLKPDGLLFYSIDELANLVENGTALDQGVINERKIFFAAPNNIIFGEEAKALTEKFLLPYSELSDVITGTIANKGKVKGKARLFNPTFVNFDSIADAVEKMEIGEILVAETTSPEIIAACKKAAAIITNQGGMLSHAAIVSRELGIPCIIGTDKDVTKNIKTGDMLEVNADEGVIKILK